MKIKVSSVKCPKCGAEEMHPDGDKLLIRAFKVSTNGGRYWWSQCLVCAGYYDKNLVPKPVLEGQRWPVDADPDAGWF